MVYNPRIHHRRSIRLKGYDYAQPGAYFVTVNCIARTPFFGEITNGKMTLNAFGEIAYKEWYRTPIIRPNIALCAFIVMPDHIHGIIIIKERSSKIYSEVGAYCNTPLPQNKFRSPSQTLGAILRGYMGTVTKQINILRGTPGQKVWQRNYEDRIIRNEKSFKLISNYINFNPLIWQGRQNIKKRKRCE